MELTVLCQLECSLIVLHAKPPPTGAGVWHASSRLCSITDDVFTHVIPVCCCYRNYVVHTVPYILTGISASYSYLHRSVKM